MSLEPGQIIDAKYRVVRRIGEGGMGTVYEGENQRIGRRVAIEVLHAQVAAMPEFVERFEREARAAARIGSSHVCDVLDLGDLPTGDRYIVMEYLDGVSFEDRLVERGKLTPVQLAPIAFELLEGLGTMHGARVIHRDLKPANVFLSKISGGRGEVVKILDFGVAKLLPFGSEIGTMTQTGTMMGTPLYMSPEQARGARDVDGRTDIYAASVMFYRALTGELPYLAETLNELLFKIVLEDPRPLRDVAPEVDEVFADIIHKGLARDLEQRFESARAYQQAIAAWGRSQGRTSLGFALTVASEPPGRLTPITLPEPPADAEASRPVASAMTGPNSGTPIAWSEDAPGPGGKSRAAATLMTPLSTASPAGEGASSPASSSKEPKAASPTTLASAPASAQSFSTTGPGASHRSADGGPDGVSATTSPGAGIAELSRAPSNAAPRAKRGLIFGMVGAGALAVGAIGAVLALGRGGGDPPAAGIGVTQGAPAAGGSGALQDPSQGLAPAHANTNDPQGAVGAAATTPSADPSSTPAASASSSSSSASVSSAAPHRDAPSSATTARKSDLPTKPTAVAASASVAAPTAGPASAKPAAARKFRTNID